MNEVDNFRSQENEAFGSFLIRVIAEALDCEADPQCIARSLYKFTNCGAFIHFDDKGVVVGTIIEGSDAEFSERLDLKGVDVSEEGAKLLQERFWEFVQQAEDFAEEQ